MTIRQLLVGTSQWLRLHRFVEVIGPRQDVDNEGLLNHDAESLDDNGERESNGNYVVKPVQLTDKRESLEKLQEGFDILVDQLRGINEHLDRQVRQHEELMVRIEKLPQWLETFPAIVDSQKQITQQMLEQLKSTAYRQDRFIEAVEKIPEETAKQTDALADINHQLAAAADVDVQMTESFNEFNGALESLEQTSRGQTDGIAQMKKTFATSDRYFKYILTQQHKRLVWLFVGSVGVCVTVILALTGLLIYIRQ